MSYFLVDRFRQEKSVLTQDYTKLRAVLLRLLAEIFEPLFEDVGAGRRAPAQLRRLVRQELQESLGRVRDVRVPPSLLAN